MCPWTYSCLPLCLLGEGFWVIFVQHLTFCSKTKRCFHMISCPDTTWNWWLSETTAILLPPNLSAPDTSDSVQNSKSSLELFLSHASSPTKNCFVLVSSWTTKILGHILWGRWIQKKFLFDHFFLLAILEEIVSCALLQAQDELHTSVDHVFGFFLIPTSSRYLENFEQTFAGLGYLNHQNQRNSSHQKPNALFCFI
jgi:hypothetical protein